MFNKKFKVDFNDGYKDINFVLLNTGVFAKLDILENNLDGNFIGTLKGKVLSSKFKLNFSSNNESIKINNFYFRDKKLSLDSEGYTT